MSYSSCQYGCLLLFIADNSFPNLHRGVVRSEMRNFITRMLNEWQIQEQLRERALDAVEFQYTHWADPENNTARGQEYINVSTSALVTGHDNSTSVVTFTVVASHYCCCVVVVSFSPTSKLVSVSTQSLNNNQKHQPHGCTNSTTTPGTTGFRIGWVSSLPVNPQTAFQAICLCSAYVM